MKKQPLDPLALRHCFSTGLLNLKFSFPLEKEYIRKNQLLHNFGTIGRILSTIVVSPYLFGKISLFSTEKIPIICAGAEEMIPSSSRSHWMVLPALNTLPSRA